MMRKTMTMAKTDTYLPGDYIGMATDCKLQMILKNKERPRDHTSDDWMKIGKGPCNNEGQSLEKFGKGPCVIMKDRAVVREDW